MPTTFHGIIPELQVPDVVTALQWYRDVLGYRIEGQTENVFGSVLRGRANIYLRQSDELRQTTYYWVFVDEVDELCQSFRERGATILEPPADKPWGYRQFTLEDLNGYRFYYFRFLEDAA